MLLLALQLLRMLPCAWGSLEIHDDEVLRRH